jgi:hypothetical protein
LDPRQLLNPPMNRIYFISFLTPSESTPLFVPEDFLAYVQSIRLVADDPLISDVIVFERIHITNPEMSTDLIDKDNEIIKFPRDVAPFLIQFLYIRDMQSSFRVLGTTNIMVNG